MNKLSRKEVCLVLEIDEKELKTSFTQHKIKSQKRRSVKSWETVLRIYGFEIYL